MTRVQKPSLKLIEKYLEDKVPAIRTAALRALAKTARPGYVERFGTILNTSRVFDERIAALEGLQRIARFSEKTDAAVFRQLKNRLTSQRKIPDKEKQKLYEALGKAGGGRAVPYLRDALAGLDKNQNRETFKALMEGLGKTDSQAAYNLLESMLAEEKNKQNRKAILKGIAAFQTKNNSEAVRKNLDRLKPQELYEYLLATVKVRKQPLPQPVINDARPVLEKAGLDLYPLALALNRYQDFNTVRKAMHSILDKENINFKTAATICQRMTQEKDHGVYYRLGPKLRKGIEDVKMLSLYLATLGELGDEKALPLLRKYADHEAKGVRFLARQGISRISGEAIEQEEFD